MLVTGAAVSEVREAACYARIIASRKQWLLPAQRHEEMLTFFSRSSFQVLQAPPARLASTASWQLESSLA